MQTLCRRPVLHGGILKSETLQYGKKCDELDSVWRKRQKNPQNLQLSKIQSLKYSLHIFVLFKEQRSRKLTTVAVVQFKLGLQQKDIRFTLHKGDARNYK